MARVALADLAEQYPGIRVILTDPKIGHTDAASSISASGDAISEAAVRRWRAANDVTLAPPEELVDENDETRAIKQGDEVDISIGKGKIPVELTDDLSPLLVFFGMNPEHYEVIDDTVRIGKWQTSKRTESGDRDVVWLWSYKARFRRKSKRSIAHLIDSEQAIEAVNKRQFKPLTRKTIGTGLGEPVTYVHHQGDEQTGKSEGGGLVGLANREADALQQSLDYLDYLLFKGHNIECVADIAAGDRAENIFGQYPSQQRTTDTLRNQLRFSRDGDITRTRAFAERGLPIKKAYTLSNHGELRQAIGQSPYTSESDNLDLIIAESVKDVIDQTSISGQVEWYIPHDQWMTFFELSGVTSGLSHGHKVSGKIEQWAQNQRDFWHFNHDIRMRMLFLGHKHHGMVLDIGGTWLIQSPSLDGGSPYFSAGRGVHSEHGIVALLVGSGLSKGWSNLTML